MNAYLNAMRKYATFAGRATRAEYWLFMLVLFGISAVALVLDAAVSSPFSQSTIFIGITYLVHFLPNLAVTVRRLHDTGHSGWWVLVCPVALFFLCLQGSPGANAYGVTPAGQLNDRDDGRERGGRATVGPLTQLNLTEELERLAQLRANGSLTDTEFDVMKARLLAKGA
ncbi:DUF805 domain-containing protein [Rhodopseudomonas sp. P2A-2r]|uniref:DUF805 domain-containing protein n=1 Tax=Rhodopseudomonas sp. P2A-2r TaxID=2991972 RepID=UPI002233F2C8|nr:DUF805 domain-containing protein [Rhodopseudomonas sp. P2A-2r]UZE49813.1 DUF805 domain-containing protein [Rhodopseudomonas sp. P2A-2r]